MDVSVELEWGTHTPDVRRYIDNELTELNPDQKTTTIRIPWSNKISVKSVDRFREMSLERSDSIEPKCLVFEHSESKARLLMPSNKD